MPPCILAPGVISPRAQEKRPELRIKAIFPTSCDRLALESRWPEAQFFMSDMEEDYPIDEGDDLVVFVYPDSAVADRVLLLIEQMLNKKPHILFNANFLEDGNGYNSTVGRALQ